MFARPMSVRVNTLAAIALTTFATTSEADPSWYLRANGTANAATVDGPAQRYMPIHGQDNPIFRDDVGPMQVASFSGTTSATSRGTISYEDGSGRAASQQAADASARVYATFGGLRAATSGSNSIGSYTGPQQFVYGSAGASISWVDTLTFHTDDALGADFRISVSLADSLSSTLSPSAGTTSFYPGQTQSYANAHTLLAMFQVGGRAFSATDNFMHIEDSITLDADHRDATGTPTATILSPPSRTLTAIVHVFDGTTIRFEQDLILNASVGNGNGTAAADASDTAWINLAALDTGATYSAASGTAFATSGDPFASTVAPVPEPSEFALFGAGLSLLAYIRTRRRPRI